MRPFYLGDSYTLTNGSPSDLNEKLLTIVPDEDYHILGVFLNVNIEGSCSRLRVQTQVSTSPGMVQLLYNVTEQAPTSIAYPSQILVDTYFESQNNSVLNQEINRNFMLPFLLTKNQSLYLHSYGVGTIPAGNTITVLTRIILDAVPIRFLRKESFPKAAVYQQHNQ